MTTLPMPALRALRSFVVCICLLLSCSQAVISSPSPQGRRYNNAVRVLIIADSSAWYSSLDVARKQVGVREKTGRNDGPEIRQYLASVGLPEGNPYCYAGHYWTFTQVTTIVPIPRTGLVARFWNDAVRYGIVTEYVPAVGDFMVWRYATSIYGHTERIVHVDNKGWVTTVAMNVPTKGRGSERDGDGIDFRHRNVRHPLGRMLIRGLVGRDRHADPRVERQRLLG